MENQVPTRLWPFFWKCIGKQKKGFIITQLACTAFGIQQVFGPLLLGMFVDRMTSYSADKSDLWSYLAPTFALWVCFWVGLEILFRIQDFSFARILPKFEAHTRMALVSYVGQHSYSYFSDHLAGDISAKINDMPTSAHDVVRRCMELFAPTAVAATLSLIWFARLQPLFAFVLAVWITLHFGICIATSKTCIRLSDTRAGSRSALSGRIVDALTNIVSVKLFARWSFEQAHMSQQQMHEQAKHNRLLRFIAWIHVALGLSSLLFNIFGIMLLVIYNWQQGNISIGEVVFIVYTDWNMMLLTWFAGIELPHWFKDLGVCQQALQVVQTPHNVVDVPHAVTLHLKKGDICFENVSFSYGKNNVLNNLTVRIAGGEKVGLVGFSGAGKSTFVNLLLRFFDLPQGRICIDEQNIAQVTRDSLRQHIAMIPQDPSLFHRSLMDNIRYGQLNASDAQVMQAAQLSHCHEFITQLPNGYATLVGERGIKLSGGQRQRIAIARAMLKDAPILVLDEATSALDSVTEQLIHNSLLKLMQGRTVVVIAHRLSTLGHMDRLLVFDNGQIVESGTHQELLAAKGHYSKLWHMQADGFLPQ
ncbi:MAG: ABC transporter ATP-binding protein [Myxococcota bacterium]